MQTRPDELRQVQKAQLKKEVRQTNCKCFLAQRGIMVVDAVKAAK